MPNVTISVPDELKAKMDTLSEVNWSEICRKAIARYIDERKYPTPQIELDLRESRLYHYSYDTGFPTLAGSLRIHNKMGSEIMVDRILYTARFVEDNRFHVVGSGYDLYKRVIALNSAGGGQLLLKLPKEKIAELEGVFNSTFDCHVRCTVFVEGFKNPYHQEVKTLIPIDVWKDVVRKVLKTPRSISVDR